MKIITNNDKKQALEAFRVVIQNYSTISDNTWESFLKISEVKSIKKKEFLYNFEDIPTKLFFVHKGLFRSYIINEEGKEYNKKFSHENSFFGPVISLLKNEPVKFEIEALEDSIVVSVDFKKYRELLLKSEELKLFHIYYLEKNWLIKKEYIETSIMQNSAEFRYNDFIKKNPKLEARLSQYHIASHLGITPTHLSRIRKSQQNK